MQLAIQKQKGLWFCVKLPPQSEPSLHNVTKTSVLLEVKYAFKTSTKLQLFSATTKLTFHVSRADFVTFVKQLMN